MISFIVSVYDRPLSLDVCLATLGIQKFKSDVTVCLNGLGENILAACSLVVGHHDVRLLETGKMGARDSYESAGMAAPHTTGEWLCFPSDDSLYVENFSGIMLETAARTGAELVYCDCVYKQGSVNGKWPAYTVLDVQPSMGRIDKTTFIVKKSLFCSLRYGFPPHARGYRDGALIEELMRAGVRHAKAPGVLVVHQ